MRLPGQKRIMREGLKDAPNWVNGLIDPINSFMERTYQAMNKNLTLTENIASFVKEFTYTTVSTYPVGQPNTEFITSLKTKPSGLMLMQVYEKNTYTPAVGPVYVPWVEKDGNIIISTITGLDANKTYLVRVVVF